MSQRPDRFASRSRPKRRRSCLGQIAILGVALLVIVAVYAVLLRPTLSTMIGAQISARLGPTIVAGAAAVSESATLPGVVSALPSGKVVVDQKEANTFLTDHQDDYGPIEQMSVRFVDGEAVADLSAMGVSGVARSGLTAVNGRVALVDPQIDGTLGLAVSSSELLTPLVDRLNAELESQGKYLESIQIEAGQIVIVTR
ncbi:MAG: hypothetical protein HGA19_20495 [Oscillochloris sp.]|nr:hypothetical protein [Oscillochloris sp.]